MNMSSEPLVPRSGRDRRRSVRWSLTAVMAFEQAREEERRRLALELHDDLGQALTGMKMDLSWLERSLADPTGVDRTALSAKVQATLQLVDQCLHTVRSVISELRPQALDQLGLIGAIEWQTDAFSRRYGIRAVFESTVGHLALDDGRATTVFRMVQEILTNVARHARATRVAVTVRVVEKTLLLSVRDNGRGLPERNGAVAGYGLLGLRERTLLLGGDFEIASGNPRGTTISIRVPLEDRRRAFRPGIRKEST